MRARIAPRRSKRAEPPATELDAFLILLGPLSRFQFAKPATLAEALANTFARLAEDALYDLTERGHHRHNYELRTNGEELRHVAEILDRIDAIDAETKCYDAVTFRPEELFPFLTRGKA